jgi:hypothetical protein
MLDGEVGGGVVGEEPERVMSRDWPCPQAYMTKG